MNEHPHDKGKRFDYKCTAFGPFRSAIVKRVAIVREQSRVGHCDRVRWQSVGLKGARVNSTFSGRAAAGRRRLRPSSEPFTSVNKLFHPKASKITITFKNEPDRKSKNELLGFGFGYKFVLY